MKTLDTVLNFNQHSWFTKVKQLQQLKLDFTDACTANGLLNVDDCELLLEQGHLQIKVNAALSARLRQIEPDLIKYLNEHHWQLTGVSFASVRHAQSLRKHIREAQWINPNQLRYGSRIKPTTEQALRLHLKRTV
jgi:hypothetical protein